MKEETVKKLLKKIITDLAGPEAEKLVDLLYKKQNVNEFIIAKKLELTINQTRNMLYKLADEGLVGFIRKKDKKKGGWYTYFWTFRVKRSLLKFKEEITKSLKDLQHQLKIRETERHFYCKNCDIEYNEENAMLQEYICAECGEVLEIRETKKILHHIKSEMKKLEEVLSQIDQEIKYIEVKEQKAEDRKLKAELKKKELERKKRKIERDKEKAKAKKEAEKEKKKKARGRAKKKIKKRFKKKARKKQKKKVKKKPIKKKAKKKFSKKSKKSSPKRKKKR